MSREIATQNSKYQPNDSCAQVNEKAYTVRFFAIQKKNAGLRYKSFEIY
jgi:hypothetical protein